MQSCRLTMSVVTMAMFRTSLVFTQVALAASSFAVPSMKAQPVYNFFSIPGAVSLNPASINDASSIVGSYTLSDGTGQAFTRNASGKLLEFGVGAVNTQPVRINQSGEIAGIFSDVAGVDQGFVRLPNGAVTRFNLGATTEVTDMNSSGTIIGIYSASSSTSAYFRTKSGVVFTFAVPGSTFVYPESINDAGQITGFYLFNGGYDGGIGGFVRAADGAVTTFVSSGGLVPLSINGAGALTGWYAPPTGSFLPFVRQPGGGIVHFRVPGTLVTQTMSINTAGVIAGSYTTVNNTNPNSPESTSHGFLRTPQGAVTSFDAPGAANTTLTAINSNNVTIGYSQGLAGTDGFVLIPGGFFTP